MRSLFPTQNYCRKTSVPPSRRLSLSVISSAFLPAFPRESRPCSSYSVNSLRNILLILVLAAIPVVLFAAPIPPGTRFVTVEDTELAGDLAMHDPEGNPEPVLFYHARTTPVHGSLSINSVIGTFTYKPSRDFFGEDSFTFVSTDQGVESSETLVVISVTPVNDAPTAQSLAMAIPPSRTLIGRLQGFDPEGDDLTYQKAGGAAHGSIEVDSREGRFTYQGAAGFLGVDSFQYTVSDGESTSEPATVAIKVGNDSVGIIGDLLNPRITSADFPNGAGSFSATQADMVGTGANGALDQVVDRANRRLYVLTADALKVFAVDPGASPAGLESRFLEEIRIKGSHLALSLDGRTLYVGGVGKVTAINLYPESVYSGAQANGGIVGQSVEAPARSFRREFPFPVHPSRDVAAMGVNPAGDRLFVVIEMDPAARKIDITNDLLRSDVGHGTRIEMLRDADLPTDFGFLTQLDIAADVQTAGATRTAPTFSDPVSIRKLTYDDPPKTVVKDVPTAGVAIGIKSLAFSPDGNCLYLTAVGAQTPRATAFGIMPTTDEGTGGIVVLDVRPAPRPTDPWVQFLKFIPTTEKGEDTAALRMEIRRKGWTIIHPQVQWGRMQYSIAEGANALGGSNPITGFQTNISFAIAADTLGILEDSFKDYGYMQAYFNLYPRDMVGASSVAINHSGDFGVVTMQNTNNLGLLTVSPSTQLDGFSPAVPPDFYIKRGTGKSINGFGDPATGYFTTWAYSWAYPQKVVFTSDDSRIYIGMAGGVPNANLTKKFGSADALMLHTQMDLLNGAFSGGNPPPGYGLYGGTAATPLKSPRSAATLQAFDSSLDLLSDQLKAYNRWNSLKTISPEWKAKLVSTDVDHLTVPGKPTANDNIADCLNFGYFLPLSGVGYRVNTFGMPKDRTNFATRGVVTALEQIGLEWNKRYHDYLGGVPARFPVTRPYFILGLLSQPGGGEVLNQAQEAMDYTPGTGAEANFPYLTIGSDKAHDFVTSNGTRRPNDNSKENTIGFDRENTEALIRLLLAEARVVRIELDPRVVDLIPDLKNERRVVVHGRLPDPGSKEIPTERRDLDNHMFVTFSSMAVDLDIDSDNNGVFDRSPEEDRAEDLAGSGGKFIAPNSGMTKNSIPDYANGFDLTPGRFQPNATAKFTPMVIRIPDGYSSWSSQFRLTYSMSDPSNMTQSVADPTQFELPHEGAYRIWTKDGDEARRKAPIGAGGDFIASNTKYSWLDLMMSARTAGSTRDFEVYIESVEPGFSETEREVIVEFFPNVGPQSSIGALVDSVFVSSAVGELAVDANRDGKITLSGKNYSDQTTPDAPFRFWINDDDDSGDCDGDGVPGIAPSVNQGYLSTSEGADWRTLHSRGLVDGRRDLIDFFPVFLQIQQLLNIYKPTDRSIRYKLKQADGALNFVYSYLKIDEATDYQTKHLTTGFGGSIEADACTKAPGEATTWEITREGHTLAVPFLEHLRKTGEGTLLLEGRCATSAPLVFSVEQDGKEITRLSLPLSICPVEDYFRHINLTDVAGGETEVPSRDTAPALPDEVTNGKNFVFLHGYNVGQNKARGWSAQMFKKMWWAGSRAKFFAVSWYGNQTQSFDKLTWNYHINVEHAFQTAPALAVELNKLSALGETSVAAHSLGNMVVLAALNPPKDVSGTPMFAPASIKQYFAFDAAVAAEAVDGTVGFRDEMSHSDWDSSIGVNSDGSSIPEGLWASEWHLQGFPVSDGRSALTWRDRLSETNGAELYNFYSAGTGPNTGEEVLNYMTTKPTPSLLDLQMIWDLVTPIGEYTWYYQELLKGKCASDLLVGSDYGGWGIARGYQVWYDEEKVDPVSREKFTVKSLRLPTREEIANYPWTDEQIRTQPLFLYGTTKRIRSDPDQPLESVAELYGPQGSDFAFRHQVKLLADMIPARSVAMGREAIDSLNRVVGNNIEYHNFDLSSPGFQDGWPQERLDSSFKSQRWLHGDAKDVAYRFNHGLFQKWVELGKLDSE